MIALFGKLSLTWRLALAAAALASVVTTYVVWRNSVWNAGYRAAMEKVETQNKEASGRAHQALARRRACSISGGVWNHVTGQCDRGL